MKKQKNKSTSDTTIALNRRARHEYFVEETFEAGIVLEGWEVKSIRSGRVQLADSYVLIKEHEMWLLGGLVTPLLSASTHIVPDPRRTRKLLLNKRQINKLIGLVERKGYALVPLKMYWKKQLVKVEIALVKGKKEHDKRATIKDREWERDKQRVLKSKIAR